MNEEFNYSKRLEAANNRIKTTDIRGKKYAEVNQRILAFYSLFPCGSILTEKTSDDGKRCDFRCEVRRDYRDEKPAATGHAFEFQSAGMVNKTSYLENCETSAVGRALGMMGIGITDALASADEVQAAIDHQEMGEEPPKAKPKGKAKKPTLQDAQTRLIEVEKRYCELFGYPDWGEYHRETIMARPDYANSVESLSMIADEMENEIKGARIEH